jgi:hypothetical protein
LIASLGLEAPARCRATSFDERIFGLAGDGRVTRERRFGDALVTNSWRPPSKLNG